MADVCPGCEHGLRGHFVCLTGEVVCLVSHSGTSSSGVLGIPYTVHCDCVNLKSAMADARRAQAAALKAEQDAWLAEFNKELRKKMDAEPAP